MEQITQTLIVTRDGSLDYEWLEALERDQKREALHQAGVVVLNHIREVPKLVGRGALSAFISFAEAFDECRS